ncbi:MAG: sulfite exporter TauE/SafE family protein [Gemmataceae bacterium]|nr:sulfite exporter TauE/SafE family protein [Gemmataceae bacterium]
MVTFLLLLSAAAAGVMNAIAGGGTLLTFPALTFATHSAKVANVTSTFALMPGSIASAWGFRRELDGCGVWVKLLTGPSIVGGAIGSLLLLAFEDKVFRAIVPWLVLLAAVLFLLQPRIAAFFRKKGSESGPPSKRRLLVLFLAQFAIGIYGGYFGAGIGILMLTTLGFLNLRDIHQMNALKTWLAFCMNGVSTILFIIHGSIHWPYALLMSAAAIVGGYYGARMSLLLKPSVVRWIVIVLGFGLAGYFFWNEYGY